MSKRKKDINVLMLFLRVAEQDRDAALADAEALRIELCAARKAGQQQEREIAALVKALAERSDMEEHARHYDASRTTPIWEAAS